MWRHHAEPVFGPELQLMNAFDRILASLHDAQLGAATWRDTSALIDDAVGMGGTHLVILDEHNNKSGTNPEWLFDLFYYHGEHAAELATDYIERFYPGDERIPRYMRLPDRRIVPMADLYTASELKTSPAYNDLLRRTGARHGLNVRMDGPSGTNICWVTTDSTHGGVWATAQIRMFESLLPHVRQFVRVRQALASADALAATLTGLLDNHLIGVLYVDRRGKIVESNVRAREILRRGDGVSDRDGVLRARQATDDASLGRLLADALPGSGRQPVSGSITLERSPLLPRLVLHVIPLVVHQLDFGARSCAALVLMVDPGSRLSIDADLVAATFRLTRAESQVAAALAEGRTVREIARTTFRAESTVRWLVKQTLAKLGISRQADLVRLILSSASAPIPTP